MQRPALTLRSLAIALPVVFVLHVLEETPGFVAWFNRQVQPDITPLLGGIPMYIHGWLIVFRGSRLI